MTEVNTLRALRNLTGDALIAAGLWLNDDITVRDDDYDDTVKIHHQANGWSAPFHTGAMECDGPLTAAPLRPAIARDVVREALDDVTDSQLLNIAATIIAGWKPILLSDETAVLTDIDLLVQALRDRADQFRAVEVDADEPFLTPQHLDAHLTSAADTFPQHRGR